MAQPEYDPEGDSEITVVVTSSMRLVSLAAGGEDEFYVRRRSTRAGFANSTVVVADLFLLY